MAKTRRRASGNRGTIVRVKKDWTYNERSYGAPTSTLSSGVANALAFPCTVSQNTRRFYHGGVPLVLPPVANLQSWAAIPEGGGQRIYAIDGALEVAPTTWNVGNEFVLGMRLLHEDQDPADGDMIALASYSMWVNTAGQPTTAMAANRGFMRERRISMGAVSGTAVTTSGQWMFPIRWRSMRGLKIGNDRAVFLYVELSSASISLRVRPWCRALMSGSSP